MCNVSSARPAALTVIVLLLNYRYKKLACSRAVVVA